MKSCGRSIALYLLLVCLLPGCSFFRDKSSGAYFEDDGPPVGGPSPASVANAVPRPEPLSRIGNSPYEVYGVTYVPIRKVSVGYAQAGEASWYGKKFHGRKTSNGDVYDMYGMTAAHKTLPLPTYLQVRNLDNGREVVVRVNDRGPFLGGRILDLSYMAAQKLGVVATGTAQVRIEVIDGPVSAKAPVQSVALDSPEAVFFLQAGSFRLATNAHRLKADLAGAGVTGIRVVTVQIGQNLYHRVQVGPIHGSAAVSTQRGIVINLTGIEPKVVKECC
ncbi:MAG: septal ring lytic transglycosylase RlpA family protein [Arenicellales bacterium]|jgi:rare lipoprotein A|nr:septal ring lytic transglycosylase RlpA family protein [Arenicellales bacterium]